MRKTGAVLLLFGILACALGGFTGCGSLFTWNGRHAVAVHDVELGTPFHTTFEAVRGRRYAAGVQVVFDRAGLPVKDGDVVVMAKLPLIASMTDGTGLAVAQLTGWLDPNEPPTMLYGRSADPRARNAELAAERLVGPWIPRVDETASINVRLDDDRSESEGEGASAAHVIAARVVIYDDRTPTPVLAGFVALGIGALSVVIGIAVLVLGAFRAGRDRDRSRLGGIPPRQIV